VIRDTAAKVFAEKGDSIDFKVCSYIYVYMYVYICLYVYIHTHICIHTHMCIHIHMCTYIHVHRQSRQGVC